MPIKAVVQQAACACAPACCCSAIKRQLDMPTLVLHGDSDIALGEELLDGIEAAVPDVSAAGVLFGRVVVWKRCH